MPDNYPGAELTLSQLIAALKMKLHEESSPEGLIAMKPTVEETSSSKQDVSSILGRIQVNVAVTQPRGSVRQISRREHEIWLKAAVLSHALQHNARLLVNIIPPELLCQIFSYLTPDFPWIPDVLRTDAEVPTPDYAWLRALTEVCSHWRAVALSEPRLWSHIALPRKTSNRLAAGAQLLERSGSIVPLHVQEGVKAKVTFWDTLEPREKFRLVSLHWCPLQSSYTSGVYKLVDLDCPNLESLAVAIWTEKLPSKILKGQTNALRHLALRYISDWDGNRFANLTHLSLIDSYEPPGLGHFLHLLSLSPRLEKLYIRNHGPLGYLRATESLDTVKKIHLPHLRIFAFGRQDTSPRLLLSYIDAHPRCMIHSRQSKYTGDVFDGTKAELSWPSGFAPSPLWLPQPTLAVVIAKVDSSTFEDDSVTFDGTTMYLRTSISTFSIATKGMQDVLSHVEEVHLVLESSGWDHHRQHQLLCDTSELIPRARRILIRLEGDHGSALNLSDLGLFDSLVESIQAEEISTDLIETPNRGESEAGTKPSLFSFSWGEGRSDLGVIVTDGQSTPQEPTHLFKDFLSIH